MVYYHFTRGIIMIDKLERKIGRFAIKNLIYYILGGYVIGYILYLLDGSLGIYNYITLIPEMVMQGQVWRLFTWIFTVPQALSFWVIFMFMLYFFIGRTLENVLGTFKYNLYIFSGWFFMTLGAMVIYWISNAVGTAINIVPSTYYINMASFLAFAVLFPNERVYFFGILPIKIKIIAIIDIVYLGLELLSCLMIIVVSGTNSQLLQEATSMYGVSVEYSKLAAYTTMFSILLSLLNFFIFFLMTRRGTLKAKARYNQFKRSSEAGTREYAERMNRARTGGTAYTGASAASASSSEKSAGSGSVFRGEVIHRCETCGRTSMEHPELQFRFCSKCSGNHEYCQDHIFTHEHIQ